MSVMREREFVVREGSIAEAAKINRRIPEFSDPYSEAVFRDRLTGRVSLILVAEAVDGGEPVGFKVGYGEEKGVFYTWLGGVLPRCRRKGIAKSLANEQESWAKKAGYTTIRLKTRNFHKGMLVFALQNGFDIVGFEPRGNVPSHRIILRKKLL